MKKSREADAASLLYRARAFEMKKDYSQGGTCKNTTSPDLSIFGFSLSGWYHASLTGDVLVPWGENDPSSEFSTTYN